MNLLSKLSSESSNHRDEKPLSVEASYDLNLSCPVKEKLLFANLTVSGALGDGSRNYLSECFSQ